MIMATVFDVAKYVLHKQGEMSTLKLQKLCYYSQAWAIAWTEKPLFDEDFEAWVNGPVCRELFDAHKGQYYIEEATLQISSEESLTEDEKDTIDTVLGFYGDMDPYTLREQTHSEPPWKDARSGCAPDERCENIITKNSMGLYYGGL